MTIVAQRPRYVPSGRVNWLKFLPLSLLSILCAAVLAVALYALYSGGWYLIILVPALAALLLSGVLAVAVRVGKCRSPLVAGALGLVAGVVMYIGYYYVGMVAMLGPQYAGRLDLLVGYISWRAHVDVQHDVGGPTLPNHDDSADAPMNWGLFGFEFLFVLAITVLLTRQRARRSFCERCGEWKVQHLALFPPGSAAAIAEWLRTGHIAQLASLRPYIGGKRQQQFTSVAVEVCPPTAPSKNCRAYLAVKDVSLGGTTTNFQKFDGSPGKLRVRREELSTEELASIWRVFPTLAGSAPAPALGAPPPPPVAGYRGASVPPPIPAALARSQLVDVQPISPADAGKVLNGWTIGIANVLMVLVVVMIVLFAAGIFAGLFLSGLAAMIDHRAAAPYLPRLVAGLALSAICLVGCVLSIYVGLTNSSVIGNRYYLARARRALALRRDRIVDPDRTGGLPIYFVEVVPRKNWGRMMLETATDVGFLQIDARRAEIRFEGDRERYRIPLEAVTNCAIEIIVMSTGQATVSYYPVVISGHTAAGPWEAPFILRQTKWLVPVRHRRKSADLIYAELMSVIPEPAPADAPEAAVAPTGLAGLAGGAPALNYSIAPAMSSGAGFWRTYGIRLAIIPMVIAFAVWRGVAHRHSSRPSAPAGLSHVQIGPPGPALLMRLSNIRTGQKLIDAPPYYAPGGTWTVFDCVADDDAGARFTVAVEQPAPAKGALPIAFSKAAILPADRDAGTRLVGDFAAIFHQPIPPPRSPQPLKPVRLATAFLGDHLGPPEFGLRDNAGTWVATKWFFQDNGLEAEVFFDYDLSSGRARFEQKDADYDADLVESIALAVRDGPRPPRTPLTDPNLTDAGPRVVSAGMIPNSADCSSDFVRGGKLLAVWSFKPPAAAWAVSLDAPGERIDLLKSDVILETVIGADADANHVLACERLAKDPEEFGPDDSERVVWFDRASGRREELSGPWGTQGSLFGQASVSRDARYVAVRGWVDEPAQKERRAIVCFYDVQKRTSAVANVAGESLELVGWSNETASPRAVLLSGESFDKIARRAFLADPATGAASPADGSALPAAADPARSPDGNLRYVLHEKKSLDVIDVATGAARTFTFHEDDRNYAVDGGVSWVSPRYLEFDTSKQGFIDVQSMKMSYLGGTSREKPSWKFSPDFKWAVQTTKEGITLGKVILP